MGMYSKNGKWSNYQKKEFARQFSERERACYHAGKRKAYAHICNLSKKQANFEKYEN